MTAERIEDWLIERLARELGVPADDIERDESFASFGLDSLKAVELAGELETLHATRLSPTLLWDHPTVRRLAAHLGSVT